MCIANTNSVITSSYSDKVSIVADLKGVTYEAKQAVPLGAVAAILVCIATGAVLLLDYKKLMLDIRMMKDNITDMVTVFGRNEINSRTAEAEFKID